MSLGALDTLRRQLLGVRVRCQVLDAELGCRTQRQTVLARPLGHMAPWCLLSWRLEDWRRGVSAR
jgi:hypothetical protein